MRCFEIFFLVDKINGACYIMLNVCVGMIKNKEESLEGIFMGENSQQNQIEELKVYAAFCSNKLLLENSASGGVALSLIHI